jgi:hypothetical protein
MHYGASLTRVLPLARRFSAESTLSALPVNRPWEKSYLQWLDVRAHNLSSALSGRGSVMPKEFCRIDRIHASLQATVHAREHLYNYAMSIQSQTQRTR